MLCTLVCRAWSTGSDQSVAVVRFRAAAARDPPLCLLFPAPLAASAVGATPVIVVNQAEVWLQLKNNPAEREWASFLLQMATQPTDCFTSAMGGHCKGELALTSWP